MKKIIAYSLLGLFCLIPLLTWGDETARDSCDRFRYKNSIRDSVSAQSYVAEVNLQRARYQVDELTLANQRQRTRFLYYLTACGIVLLTSTGAGTLYLRRKNRQLKSAQAQLKQAQQAAERSIRTKNLFLSNMSHEIRTPLNALSGFSSILTDSNIDGDIRMQCNDIIQQNSDLLIKLIDDVVDLSNLEKGTMQFHMADQECVSLCRRVIDTVERIKQTAAAVLFEAELTELTLHTDEARLQQLLINLLINATKFTPEGSITLRLEIQGEMALFSVTDTGCGIAPEQREKVFNRFEKLDENAQGSGLGLSICQLIIQRFGGRIWIDPDYSGGTRFCFTHPLSTPQRKEKHV
ncbi:MAG: HAMP domain-containing histidine kinase [Mediterranea sp.]|nr:HAMP domain-containing histidine kinase [Mediterranea sp.]